MKRHVFGLITPGMTHSSLSAFLYPGYASYKTLSQRPASEEEIERWLMYWSILGCIVAVEHVAEWAVSWYAQSSFAPYPRSDNHLISIDNLGYLSIIF